MNDLGYAFRTLPKSPGFGLIAILLSRFRCFCPDEMDGSLLHGVSAHELSIHGLGLILFAGAGLIASYIPARRALAVDPMVALRYE